ELVAGLDDTLELAVVDAREERDLAAVRLIREHGDRSGLRDRLDREHARHHRPRREVPREPPVVGADRPPRDDALSRLQLENLVDEEERVPVRDDLLDLLAPEGHGRRHQPSSTPSPAGPPPSPAPPS